MKINVSSDWLKALLDDPDYEEPGGLMACSPEIYKEMQKSSPIWETNTTKTPTEMTKPNLFFRKKPVVIQAFQMTEERGHNNTDWPEWLHMAWNGELNLPGTLQRAEDKESLDIITLEGKQRVQWDDFIIQGVHGEIYPCKPDIFEKTYEPVIPIGGH